MKLKELVDALAGATEPDRALDSQLALIAGYKKKAREDGGTYWVDASDNGPSNVPRFTNNIDAALDLVGIVAPDVAFGVSWEPGDAHARIGERPYCRGANPAIALCLAAMSYRLRKKK